MYDTPPYFHCMDTIWSRLKWNFFRFFGPGENVPWTGSIPLMEPLPRKPKGGYIKLYQAEIGCHARD